MTAVTFDQILAYAAGELDATTAQAVEQAVNASPDAAATLRRVSAAVATMRTDDSLPPSESARQRARQIFASAAATQRRSWLDGVREIVASLVYDSRLQPALAGYRSAGGPVQVTYATAETEVDLQIEPTDDARSRIVGQVATTAGGPMLVQLINSDAQTVFIECNTDDHGVFTITVPAGRYEMAIRAGDSAIVIRELGID